jgi:hypothetical protein
MSNKFLLILLVSVFLAFNANSQNSPAQCSVGESIVGSLCVKTIKIDLVDNSNPITIKVYTKRIPDKAIDRTFVVVHNNEQKGLNAVKEVLSENGFYGRLVEVVSNYKDAFNLQDTNNKGRYLHFGGGRYCIDPNRIYSVTGRTDALKESKCIGTPRNSETNNAVKLFADNLLNIVTLNDTHKFIIGVHNNTKDKELSLDSWSGAGSEAKTASGIFKGNIHGNPASTVNTKTDDFVLATNGYLAGQFLDNRVYSVALQEGRNYLIQEKTNVDDGSMSIYFGMTLFGNTDKPFSYINIEAGGKDNAPDTDNQKKWQKEMIKMALTKIKTH